MQNPGLMFNIISKCAMFYRVIRFIKRKILHRLRKYTQTIRFYNTLQNTVNGIWNFVQRDVTILCWTSVWKLLSCAQNNQDGEKLHAHVCKRSFATLGLAGKTFCFTMQTHRKVVKFLRQFSDFKMQVNFSCLQHKLDWLKNTNFQVDLFLSGYCINHFTNNI